MTSIYQALAQQLTSLQQLLEQLPDSSYCYQSQWLSDASIGQHTRHVIELVQCLVNGYEDGMVNYDERKRDKQIETDRYYAMSAIEHLKNTIIKEDKVLMLAGNFCEDKDAPISMVPTTYNREIVYNIEHAVHHMALIKVGLKEQDIDVVQESFGVAYATIQYRKLCAQ